MSAEAWVPGNPNDRSVTGFRIRCGSAKGPLSRGVYYRMKAEGLGPRETYLSPHRIIITAKDEAEWLEARANPQGTEARLIAKAEEAQRSARARPERPRLPARATPRSASALCHEQT